MTASISAIVPAYNAERTLGDTLDSISRQTRQPTDVIVVDDGSKDRTAEVARSFSGRLPNLQVISVENGGVSRARNLAIAASRGEIIAPIDADDMWHPTYLERVGRRLEQLGPQAAFAYSFWRSINADGMASNLNDVVGLDGMGFYRLLVHNFVGNGSNFVMWRHRVGALVGFNEKLPGNEDYDLQLRLAWTGPMGVVPERLVGYRDSPDSLSKQWRLMAKSGIPMLQKLREDLPADPTAMDWAMSSSHLHFHLVIMLFGAGSWMEAVQQFVIGARYDPVHAYFRVGASVKSRLYRRLQRLRSGWTPPVTRPFTGIHFYDIEPTVNWPTILPRFTRLRLAESEGLDRRRAVELGLAVPGAAILDFPEKFPPGWAGPDLAIQG